MDKDLFDDGVVKKDLAKEVHLEQSKENSAIENSELKLSSQAKSTKKISKFEKLDDSSDSSSVPLVEKDFSSVKKKPSESEDSSKSNKPSSRSSFRMKGGGKSGFYNKNHHKNSNSRVRQPLTDEELASDNYVNMLDLKNLTASELLEMAKSLSVEGLNFLKTPEIIFKILQKRSQKGELLYSQGVLNVLDDGYGFLRSPQNNYLSSPDDVYISAAQIRLFGLQTGDTISGQIRYPKEGERYFALQRIHHINGLPPDECKNRIHFSSLTPLYPKERFFLENEANKDNMSMRIMDLLSPIGKGQRGLVVAPPKSGKTMLLQNIANSILRNYPNVKMMVLLIDERPEEVTDMKRNVNAEVISSTFDEPPESHVHVAEMVVEKARRLVELGNDVVILLDSITRLSRAYNAVVPHSGKILSGGVDATALNQPKRFFGAARNIEEGGSLTILSTVLVDTGSRMEEVVFEELKGRGNMELTLDRRLAERRIYPAIDVSKSGTRREDILFHPEEQKKIYLLRKGLCDMNSIEAMEFLRDRMKKTRNNVEFLMSIKADSSSASF